MYALVFLKYSITQDIVRTSKPLYLFGIHCPYDSQSKKLDYIMIGEHEQLEFVSIECNIWPIESPSSSAITPSGV